MYKNTMNRFQHFQDMFSGRYLLVLLVHTISRSLQFKNKERKETNNKC